MQEHIPSHLGISITEYEWEDVGPGNSKQQLQTLNVSLMNTLNVPNELVTQSESRAMCLNEIPNSGQKRKIPRKIMSTYFHWPPLPKYRMQFYPADM